MSSVQTKASSSVGSWRSLASGLAYEPFGAVKGLTLGNGLAVTNGWGDPGSGSGAGDGRLAARRLYRTSDNASLSDLAYSYDADGNIAGITDQVNASGSVLYGYDSMGRLTLTAVDGGGAGAQSYSYTSGTNRLASVTDAAGTRSIAYDARGNTASETRPGSIGATTTYDGYGRLTGYSRTDTGTQAFVYNGLDDRTQMSDAVATRRFVYDGDGRVLGEYGASASDVKAEFIWALPQVGASGSFGGDDGIGGYAPLVVATPDSGGTVQLNWVHANHLGVPLVTTDATGAPATTPNDYLVPGFPGQSRTIADLYYNRYRDYDPTTGRYIQADPIGLEGGSNPYLYAEANPINAIDPLGLEKVDLFNPNGDRMFHNGVDHEPDNPGVCQVYGHMAPSGIEVWINGRKVFLTRPVDIKRELIKRGCKPKQPVYFLGCRAAMGDNSIAENYARAMGVSTVGSTRQTWWSQNGFDGTFGRQNPSRGQPGYNKQNRNDPGQWKVFGP